MNASHSDTVLERAQRARGDGCFPLSAPRSMPPPMSFCSPGFDRADIDVLDSLDQVPARLGPVYVAPEELADVKDAPRGGLSSRPTTSQSPWPWWPVSLGSAVGLAVAYAVLARGGSGAQAGCPRRTGGPRRRLHCHCGDRPHAPKRMR